jgi:hypothetical protein
MMLLISLAILVAFGASVATLFGVFELEFWWELALLIVIMLLGHWLEMRALGQASSALMGAHPGRLWGRLGVCWSPVVSTQAPWTREESFVKTVPLPVVGED